MLRATLLACLSLLGASSASATDAGLRQLTVQNLPGDAGPISVALYYPTQAQARPIAMGPFTVHVAIQGPCQPPCSATSLSAAAGPHDPFA